MELIKFSALFAVTALSEILGCYLPWLVLKQDKSPWLWLPAIGFLVLFAWLLTLHPSAAGRTYAAYGGMYITVYEATGLLTGAVAELGSQLQAGMVKI